MTELITTIEEMTEMSKQWIKSNKSVALYLRWALYTRAI